MCQVQGNDGTTACFTAGSVPGYSACAASSDCQAGYDCISGSCQQYCDSDSDCPGAFDACGGIGYDNSGTFTLIPGFKTCTRTCNPASPQSSAAPYQACGAGLNCVPSLDDTSICIGAGSGQAHGSCTEDGDCGVGLNCVNSECLKGCNNINGSCGGGETCYGLIDQSNGDAPITVAGAQIGVCAP